MPEFLQQMATTAFQTINPAKVREEMREAGAEEAPDSDNADGRIAEKWLVRRKSSKHALLMPIMDHW